MGLAESDIDWLNIGMKRLYRVVRGYGLLQGYIWCGRARVLKIPHDPKYPKLWESGASHLDIMHDVLVQLYGYIYIYLLI